MVYIHESEIFIILCKKILGVVGLESRVEEKTYIRLTNNNCNLS